MAHVLKLLSLAFAMGISAFNVHAAIPPPPISSDFPAGISGPSSPAATAHTDGLSTARWTAIEQAAEAELAAEQAQEQAAATAAAAAAAANVVHPSGPSYGKAQVQDLIRQAFAPQGAAAVDWGLRVAACESGYNPLAYNPDGASGVFQFMPGTFRGTPYGSQNIFDAVANVDAAAWYYGQHGGGAWSCH